jgi:hypothetical protein
MGYYGDQKMRVKVSWFAVANIIIKQIKALLADIERDRADGQITKEEWQDILAENLLEIIPEIAEAMVSANR